MTKAELKLLEQIKQAFSISDDFANEEYLAHKTFLEQEGNNLTPQQREIGEIFLESRKNLADWEKDNPVSKEVYQLLVDNVDVKVVKKIIGLLNSPEYKQVVTLVEQAFKDNALRAIEHLDSLNDEGEIAEPNTSKYLH